MGLAKGCRLLHQQHLPGTLDRGRHLPLIMSREIGVFTRQDAAVVGYKLPQQIDVTVIESVKREIDLRLWPLIYLIGARGPGVLVGTFLFRHDVLLDFAVQSVSFQEGIELLLFNLLLLGLFIARRLVARDRLAFLSRFCAFDSYNFTRHGSLSLFFGAFIRGRVRIVLDLHRASGINRTERAEFP